MNLHFLESNLVWLVRHAVVRVLHLSEAAYRIEPLRVSNLGTRSNNKGPTATKTQISNHITGVDRGEMFMFFAAVFMTLVRREILSLCCRMLDRIWVDKFV